jgi:CDP-glucose 4,6-dehydratase
MDNGFWRGRRVFVTGHTGFKGGWLTLWLRTLGAEVAGYALAPPTEPALFDIARVAQGITHVLGDVRDAARLDAALRDFAPEVVIHMAAQPLVRASYADPVGTYATNVMGTVHLLEAVRRLHSVRAVVNVTTDKCYENREWLWGYREDEAMGGHDPYSSSKGCAELLTAAWRRSFLHEGVAVASARAGNVIGGGDWAAERLVPDVLKAFAQGEPVTLRNPLAVRPWQHVLEPLCGYLTLAQRLHEQGQAYAEGWNFGPADDDARPVGQVVQRLAAQWGEGAHWRQDPAAQPHEAQLLKLDCSKARQRLRWQPRWGLDETLRRIVAWHRAWLGGADMREHCLQEINDYMHQGHR